MVIDKAYAHVKREISVAAQKAGRDPSSITLVAVTKTVPWEKISRLYELGQRDFGESRVVDALNKIAEAPKDCRWHMIGTLQSNKVRKVLGNFVLIHSVDTPALAKKISDVSHEMNITTEILLQVNTSGESSKHGLAPESWLPAIEEVFSYPHLKISGLMTMAPLVEDEKLVRKCFADLRLFRDKLAQMTKHPLPILSMGMSHDFAWAIAEGATHVRIGTALWEEP